MHAAIDNLKAKRLVDSLRIDIVNPGIGSHLDATLATRPILCSRQQQGAHAPPAMAFHHEPTFHETNGVAWVAAVGVRA